MGTDYLVTGHVTTCSPVIGCQERLKETEFYTKPIIEQFDQTKSVKVGTGTW